MNHHGVLIVDRFCVGTPVVGAGQIRRIRIGVITVDDEELVVQGAGNALVLIGWDARGIQRPIFSAAAEPIVDDANRFTARVVPPHISSNSSR